MTTSERLSLELVQLDVGIGGRRILNGLNLSLEPGTTALVGRNGAGKTTAIRAMCGLLKPSVGQVRFCGMDIHSSSAVMKDYRRELGWLPQEAALPPRMTVRELVAYAAWLTAMPKADRAHAAAVAIGRAGLDAVADDRLGALSGGQRRRAAFAAALVGDPRVLLLDEPTVALDPMQRDELLLLIERIASDRVVVVSTHLFEDVAAVATSVCVLESGTITRSGSLADFVDDPADPSVRQLRAALFPAGTPGAPGARVTSEMSE